MKKFSLALALPLLLAFAFFMPTVTAEAADIPSFSRVAGNYAPFKLKEDNRKGGRRTYYYECSVDLRENFAAQYINLLKRSRLTYIGHETNDWRRQNPPRYLDKWILSCKGQRVEVWQFRYFDEGRMTFSVKVPYGLTYEGD